MAGVKHGLVLAAPTIADKPAAARDRLKEWQGLTEQPLLYPPTVGVAPGRVRENFAAIADTFGS